jgi:hypothetical protein
MSPLRAAPTTAMGAARESMPYGMVGRMCAIGGSARVVLTITSATAQRAMIVVNGADVSMAIRPIKSCPIARAMNVPTI